MKSTASWGGSARVGEEREAAGTCREEPRIGCRCRLEDHRAARDHRVLPNEVKFPEPPGMAVLVLATTARPPVPDV